jgi:hypothetical protein
VKKKPLVCVIFYFSVNAPEKSSRPPARSISSIYKGGQNKYKEGKISPPAPGVNALSFSSPWPSQALWKIRQLFMPGFRMGNIF